MVASFPYRVRVSGSVLDQGGEVDAEKQAATSLPRATFCDHRMGTNQRDRSSHIERACELNGTKMTLHDLLQKGLILVD